jgi:hypothetical protein
MTRKSMANKRKIIDYWVHGLGSKLLESRGIELGCFDKDNYSCCFACGDILQVERYHILAIAEGGLNSVDNLHLLCKYCHLESEMISGVIYWEWLENKHRLHFKLPGVHTWERLKTKGYSDDQMAVFLLRGAVILAHEYLSRFLPVPLDFVQNLAKSISMFK